LGRDLFGKDQQDKECFLSKLKRVPRTWTLERKNKYSMKSLFEKRAIGTEKLFTNKRNKRRDAKEEEPRNSRNELAHLQQKKKRILEKLEQTTSLPENEKETLNRKLSYLNRKLETLPKERSRKISQPPSQSQSCHHHNQPIVIMVLINAIIKVREKEDLSGTREEIPFPIWKRK
jgi:hypothetical protein